MWIFAGICGFIFFMMLGFFKYKKWFWFNLIINKKCA
jgi:hypothetical protein